MGEVYILLKVPRTSSGEHDKNLSANDSTVVPPQTGDIL